VFTQVSYLGKRAANAANAFYLPAFTTVDIGGSWNINKHIKAQVNVNNLFNQVGIMSWSMTGFLASLNRQGLTAAQYNPTPSTRLCPARRDLLS
jgi:outer membrane receptor protein involved in Fe transport